MNSLLRISLLAVAVLSAPAICRAADKESAGVASGFINSYIEFISAGTGGGYEAAISWMEKRPDVTENFCRRLAKLYRDALKEDPELGYGADAVIGGQDFPSGFRVKSSDTDSDSARVVLESADQDFPMEIKVDLVRSEDGSWLVDGSGDLAGD
ncbi:MAG: hypothetical protein FGM15_09370 [Chthoniobacterales bacterium]|nr:hypothetical protein [Chthoniobacterales bacterium]